MTQLEFNFKDLKEPKVGQPLYPQPPKQSVCFWNGDKNNSFSFSSGNELDGFVVFLTVDANIPNIVPVPRKDGIWTWQTADDFRNYLISGFIL